jgi:ADP-ribose pyrophosphatase YjhB (NUDIX family)
MARFCWRCRAALSAPPPTSCDACGQPHYNNPRPCGEAVVVRGHEVLLLRRAMDPESGAWDVPGGFCDTGEHPMRAAERELEEETGLAGRAVAYVGTWMDAYGEEGDGVQIHTAVSAYLIELSDPGAPMRLAREEVSDARWFALTGLPEQLAFATHTAPMLAAVAAIVAGRGRPLPDRSW